jgi:CelD/BcsL family acetyltransferase involved in cellulose biosynthesis
MIQSISNIADFEKVRREWEKLYMMSGRSNLFLTHGWLVNWVKHFGKDRWVVIVEGLRDENEFSAAGIFQITEGGIGFIDTLYSHFPGILHGKGRPAPLQEIVHHLKKMYNAGAIHLVEYPKEDSSLAEIKSAVGIRWQVLEKNEHMMRSIAIPGDFESYLNTKSKKLRHELERKNRKMEKEGVTELRCFDKPAELDELFRVIEDIENDSWKCKAGTAIISNESEQGFYKSVFRLYSSISAAKGYVLYHKNIPVTYVLGVVFEGKYYALKTSFKESVSILSPGTVLFFRVLQKLDSDGTSISRVELLGGDARWKNELCTDAGSYCTYVLYPMRPLALLYVAAYKYLRPIIKRLPIKEGYLNRLRRITGSYQ